MTRDFDLLLEEVEPVNEVRIPLAYGNATPIVIIEKGILTVEENEERGKNFAKWLDEHATCAFFDALLGELQRIDDDNS